MFRWILLVTMAAMLALFVACGDDDDDALSEEDYLAEMTAINAEHNELVFAELGETAGDVKEQFAMAVDTPRERFGDLTPPANLQDEHDTLIEAIETYDEALTSAAEGIDDEGEPGTFFVVFEDEDVKAADEEVRAVFQAIQAHDDKAGVEVGFDWMRRR